MTASTSAQDATFVAAAAVWLKLANPTSAQTKTFRSALSTWVAQANPPASAPTPNVIGASFVIAAGYGLDALVGAIKTDIAATSFTISGGDPNGYFMIYPSGNLRTSATMSPPPGIYNLKIIAANAAGSGLAASIGVTMQEAAVQPPPLSPPPPPLTGFPDATNTGVPSGTTLTPSGALQIITAGQIVSGLNINGGVRISANNVTLQNCRITGGGYWQVSVDGGCSGVTIKNCDLDGQNGATDGASAFYIGNTGTPGPTPGLQIIGNNVHGFCNGLSVGYGPILLRDNYIHDLMTSGTGHINGVQYNGGASFSGLIDIEHNTIINANGQTDCIMLDNFYGAVANVTVNNNHLSGGDFTIYCDGRFNNTPFTNVRITNNRVGKAQYDYKFFGGTGSNVVWTGNVDDVSGAAI